MGMIGRGAEEGAEHVDELCSLEGGGLGEGAEDGDIFRTGGTAGSHADFSEDDERAQRAFCMVVGGRKGVSPIISIVRFEKQRMKKGTITLALARNTGTTADWHSTCAA